MIMSRVTLLHTIFAIMISVASAPIEIPAHLERRITHTGRGTWFYPGLGNCGIENSVNDPIIAIPKSLYNENGGSNCGQWIRITDTNTGKVAYGLTEDSCPGCGSGDLDMSPAVFEQFTPLSTGVISISWNFLAPGESPP